MSERSITFWYFVADEAKKWATRACFMAVAALLAIMVNPYKQRLADIWHSPEQLTQISDKLDTLTSEVLKATGEDRVVYEVPGLTFVVEPVYVGDRITLNMVVRRTRLGSACTAISRTALFTDMTNIATPGEAANVRQQIRDADTPMRMVLDVPSQVKPGRVTVHLSLEYDCGGKRVFDSTRPTAFMLLEKRT